jgi:hypothetical protein
MPIVDESVWLTEGLAQAVAEVRVPAAAAMRSTVARA